MKKQTTDWSAWMWLIPLAVGAFILLHSIGLTKLPIFADEAIYLRWAQLIISEPRTYAFFPLNDGKTPLFVWSVIPLLLTNLDPVLAGRLWSLTAGVIQVVIIGLIAKKLQLGKLGIVTTFAIVTLAPFWFFHHRMALMDAWLTALISLTMLCLLSVYEVEKEKKPFFVRQLLKNSWAWLSAIAFGLAILIKVPAILAAPALVLTPWLVLRDWRRATTWSIITAVILGVGLALSSLVVLHPAGPQLFSRSSDFLLPIGEVLGGAWRGTVPSLPTYVEYFIAYLSPGVILLALVPLLFAKYRRVGLVLWVQFAFFFTPIWILGRVVYPRYLFPASLWLTLAAALGMVVLVHWSRAAQRAIWQKILGGLAAAGAMLLLCLNSLQFVLPAWIQADAIPFLKPDVAQYQSEWSSGHGTREIYGLMHDWSVEHPEQELLVATEGRFGTLPDALLLYNFNYPLPNVRIEGAEIAEVHRVPLRIQEITREKQFNSVWLVVNSNRLFMSLPPETLLAEYCRPVGDNCLQLWDITLLLEQSL